MTLEFHPYVLEDVRVAAQGYLETSPAMADAFLAEVSARLGKVLDDPDGFPMCGMNTSFRRAKLWRFPQSIVYRVAGEVIYVSLIAQALTQGEVSEEIPIMNPGLNLTPPRDVRLPA